MKEPLRPDVELAALLRTANPSVAHALLLMSEFLQQSPGIAAAGLASLDEMAERLVDHAADKTTVSGLVDGIFVDMGFAGDVEDYHAEENSFLDRVLDRRVGMPISLSALVVAIGSRVGIELALIGLPGHVVVGVVNDHNTFIDAFSGTQTDRNGLEARLRSIFGHDVPITDEMLAPMDVPAVITRVSNNLMASWSGDAHKVDRLLELRAVLPLRRADQRRVIEVAEARGRFDIAAALRESIDPSDPKIEGLWGRLN